MKPSIALAACLLGLLPGVRAGEAPNIQSLDDLRATAERFLQQAAARDGREVQVEIGRLDPRLRLVACPGPVEPFLGPGSQPRGNTAVGLRCDGAAPWKLYVPATVRQKFVVLTAARAIPKGRTLTTEDILPEERWLTSAPPGALDSPVLAVGRLATRSLQAGSLLNGAALKAPQLVRRGQTVVLSLNEGPIDIQLSGEALGPGAPGDRIQVRNASSRRVVEGVVTEGGEVRVLGAASP